MNQLEQQINALNVLITAHNKTIKTIEENKSGLTGRILNINLNGLNKEIESLKKQKSVLEIKLNPKQKTNEDLDFLSVL